MLNEKSCGDIIGQGQFLQPRRSMASAVWVAWRTPFKDPVAGYQPTLQASESAPANWSYPVVLQTEMSGCTSGVRLETDPPAGRRFLILGGREQIGSVSACAAAVTTTCIAPNAPEGASLAFHANVLDARTHRVLFTETGEFVQDTEPPSVEGVTVRPSAGGFTATVDALDATSSPLAAKLWCSLDGGATWQVAGLSPTSDILNASHSRSFTGNFAAPPTASVRYYVVVQDALDNEDWYGPETLTAAPTPPARPSPG